MTTDRALHEIDHGKKLAALGAEDVWGWGSAAGQLRARRRAELILRGAELGPGMKALEIGCGTGLFTRMFAESGAEIVAVDISGELLEEARKRGLPPDRVRFVEMRFEDSDIHGPFDAVIGSSILHHLEIEAALRRIFELLKPRGRMSFAEPNMLNPQIAIQKNVPWIKERLGDSPDETAFIRFSFAKLLERAGFERTEIVPFDWLHPGTPVPLIAAVSRLGGLFEKLPGVREFAGSLLIRAVRDPH